MSGIDYIMYAGMVFCITMGIYLFVLARKQARLSRRLDFLQVMLEEKE